MSKDEIKRSELEDLIIAGECGCDDCDDCDFDDCDCDDCDE